ncbi:hypothetical protein DRQ09_05980 [candidate division KSB1 bacterium]|nr:MAG: hypothetical protein DRQ09_05980 [candidate division KSB1 bacterium]
MPEEKIGIVTGYFSKIGVAVIKITSGSLKIGDEIHIKGHTTDFSQRVESMQISNQPVNEVKVDDEFGLKVNDRVRRNDEVFKVT